jgi:hypothetical protein
MTMATVARCLGASQGNGERDQPDEAIACRLAYSVSAGDALRYRSADFLAVPRASSVAANRGSVRWQSRGEAAEVVVGAAHRSQERSPGAPRLAPAAADDSSLVPP